MGMEIAQLYKMALSDKSGEAVLTLPSDFNNNDGVATLQEIGDGKKISVQTSTLDSLDLKRQVRLMKIDVEGHELSVLKGAEESFKKNLFEYILFEELSGYKNSQTAKFLEDRGYKILKLVKSFNGLMLVAPELEVNNSYEPDNFLATKDSTIFEKINHKPEWKIFAWKPKTK
jgi:hypothetical protein